jgi:1-acyl-sn-glycerol-3-phosphate acyltransferase
MQNIVIDKPYRFVPPKHGGFWPRVLTRLLPGSLRRNYGVATCRTMGMEALKSSLAAGHGILLTPNHCRPCDPLVVAMAVSELSQPLYCMASWHLFMQGGLYGWLLPRGGAFSVYREGLDREALKCAIDVLGAARRPLVIFPEGAVTRTNDRLNHLMDGTAFIARSAAKQCAAASPPRKVVVHPVAIRYFFGGNVEQAVTPVLEDIERRLSWQPQGNKSLLERMRKVGDALLTLKEIEYFEQPQIGTLDERLAGLIDKILAPLEEQWLKGKRDGDVVSRVKTLRAAILPDMISGQITEEDRACRWRQLVDCYLAQQASFYPPNYFSHPPTPEQMLETVERFEEDLTDQVRTHRPLHAVVAIGQPIEVSTQRQRGVEVDPLMAEVRAKLETMLAGLKENRP